MAVRLKLAIFPRRKFLSDFCNSAEKGCYGVPGEISTSRTLIRNT